MYKAKMYEQRNINLERHQIDLNEKELLNPINTWFELDEKVQKEIKAARLNLAQEFRDLIGVS